VAFQWVPEVSASPCDTYGVASGEGRSSGRSGMAADAARYRWLLSIRDYLGAGPWTACLFAFVVSSNRLLSGSFAAYDNAAVVMGRDEPSNQDLEPPRLTRQCPFVRKAALTAVPPHWRLKVSKVTGGLYGSICACRWL